MFRFFIFSSVLVLHLRIFGPKQGYFKTLDIKRETTELILKNFSQSILYLNRRKTGQVEKASSL